MFVYKNIRLSITQVIAASFAVVILIGALLLSLPAASKSGVGIPFLNAVFTATSATCVTGLVVYDTFSQFTTFGQVVILLMIQIGGLGFMTIATLLAMAVGKRIGLRERNLLVESVNTLQLGGITQLLRRILMGTVIFEGLGTVLLALRFCPMLGFGRGLYYAVFHSISAFCNAGFDLMGFRVPYGSFTTMRGDLLVNLVIMGLIIIGGIGFIVWDDVYKHKWHFRRYMLHSKIVIAASLLLLVVPTILFFIVEANHTLAGLPLGEKWLASAFQAVSPRTAGFNTVELSDLSEAGGFLTIFLMIIGASPGSTGGGIKTTTFVVMLLAMISYIKRDADLNIFDRRLGESILRRAFCVAILYALFVGLGSFLLLALQNLPLKDTLFEAVSAMSTVGLSTGITRSLSAASKVIIILLMYCGRVGSLTVVMAVAERRNPAKIKNLEEKITIG